MELNNPQNKPSRGGLPSGAVAAPRPFPTSFPASSCPRRGRVSDTAKSTGEFLSTISRGSLSFSPSPPPPPRASALQTSDDSRFGKLFRISPVCPPYCARGEAEFQTRTVSGAAGDRLCWAPGLPPRHAFTDSPVFSRRGISHLILTSTQSRRSSNRNAGLSCSSSFCL